MLKFGKSARDEIASRLAVPSLHEPPRNGFAVIAGAPLPLYNPGNRASRI